MSQDELDVRVHTRIRQPVPVERRLTTHSQIVPIRLDPAQKEVEIVPLDIAPHLDISLARARELSITRLLGDIRGMGAYESGSNTLGRYEIASSIAEQLPYDMKVAFLNAEHQMDKFNENVSVNRGATALLTTVLDESLEWLGVDTANKPDAGDGK